VRVVGLNGKVYQWKARGRKPRKRCSSYHLRARNLLREMFPLDERLEEVYLPGAGRLFLDFYIPGWRLAVEVHGEQHYQYVHHFHRGRLGQWAANARDSRKADWCALNAVRLVELPHGESDEQWQERVRVGQVGGG
jgi:hypothetical protein